MSGMFLVGGSNRPKKKEEGKGPIRNIPERIMKFLENMGKVQKGQKGQKKRQVQIEKPPPWTLSCRESCLETHSPFLPQLKMPRLWRKDRPKTNHNRERICVSRYWALFPDSRICYWRVFVMESFSLRRFVSKSFMLREALALLSLDCWPCMDSYQAIPAHNRRTSARDPSTLCCGDPAACHETGAI